MRWMQDGWRRVWKNRKRLLEVRDHDPCNRGKSFAEEHWWNARGWIYVLFHFPTGRVYVGQTSREVFTRAKEHWYGRERLEDHLHGAIANGTTPFSYIMLPLEKVAWRADLPKDVARGVFSKIATDKER